MGGFFVSEKQLVTTIINKQRNIILFNLRSLFHLLWKIQ